MNIISRIEWRIYKDKKRRRLKNTSPSIISSNCNGGVILHDLGLRFNTPTVNLLFEAHDYIKFISDIDRYLSAELVEMPSDKPYPVGLLDDVKVYFMHYDSFENAKAKWYERRERVDRGNMFFMFTDKDGCTDDDLSAFDALPYKNKVVFTHVPRPDIKSSYYIKGFENNAEVGILSDFKEGFLRRRYIDQYDYVSFLNGDKD
ncbi:MAG: DUF1919 domain-containing protein [Clostridia bacterium]|nr:DUF1919 domain-containing protein [Clostridia bacterium]